MQRRRGGDQSSGRRRRRAERGERIARRRARRGRRCRDPRRRRRDAIADAGPGVPDAPFITDSGFVYTPAAPGASCRSTLFDGGTGQISCGALLDCCESIGSPAQCLAAGADASSCFSVSTCDGPETARSAKGASS
ncbi:MAG: hypothetical protein U0235_01450 [Polyangiaceae bacterium]